MIKFQTPKNPRQKSMPTLQKFKLLATQCTVAGSPTRSPSQSPIVHLRRRKTLRMFLGKPIKKPNYQSPDNRPPDRNSPEKAKELSVSHKLKDLFVSSPPAFDEGLSENVRDGLLPASGGRLRRGGPRFLRPLSATFRQRLLRRAWRPVLVAIPE